MSTGDLPKYAAKGERQKLDRDWIKLLHQEVKGLQYPALTHLLDPLHRFVEWYAGSLSTLPTDSLFTQKMEKGFPAAPRPVSGWLQLLAAIRLGDVKQPEEDQAGRLVKPPSELISVGQVAAILSVHQNTVRRWAAEGLLTAYRVGLGEIVGSTVPRSYDY